MKMKKAKQERKLDELKPTPYNPRLPWAGTQGDDFKRSLSEFGDLSGIILNRRTGHLVGGNKRTEAFTADASARIVDVKPATDDQGTVAHGFVVVHGTRFAFREVDWPDEKERLANLAANKWSAEWDDTALADMLKGMKESGLDVALAGFDESSLIGILNKITVEPPEDFKSVGSDIETEFQCPKCSYKWSGKPS